MNKKLLVICLLLLSSASLAQSQREATEVFSEAVAKYFSYSSLNRWSEAKPYVAKAYELGQLSYSETDPSFGPIAYRYGSVLVALDDPNSLDPLLQARRNMELNLGSDSLELVAVLSDLGAAHILNRQPNKALETANKAIRMASKEYGEDSTLVANLSSRLGEGMAKLGEYGVALRLQDSAYDIYEAVLSANSSKAGMEAYRISESHRLNKNIRGQVTFLKKTISSFDQESSADTEFERRVHTKLVKAYHQLDKAKRANKHVLALASSNAYPNSVKPVAIVSVNAALAGKNNKASDGSVSLKFDVDTIGLVKNIQLVELNGDRKLVKLARQALEGARYIPAKLDGVLLDTEDMETKIVFKRET